jgi:hypothetical protein
MKSLPREGEAYITRCSFLKLLSLFNCNGDIPGTSVGNMHMHTMLNESMLVRAVYTFLV